MAVSPRVKADARKELKKKDLKASDKAIAKEVLSLPTQKKKRK